MGGDEWNRSRSHTLVAALAVAFVGLGGGGLLLTGCGNSQSGPVASDPATSFATSTSVDVDVAVSAPLPSVTTAHAVDAGPSPVITAFATGENNDSLIEGPLLNRHGCIYIEVDALGIGVAIFNHGTGWDPATESIAVSDGTFVAMGDRISVGGGSAPIAELASFAMTAEDAVEVQRCADAEGTSLAILVGNLTAAAA